MPPLQTLAKSHSSPLVIATLPLQAGCNFQLKPRTVDLIYRSICRAKRSSERDGVSFKPGTRVCNISAEMEIYSIQNQFSEQKWF
jgi:hypothetical protein